MSNDFKSKILEHDSKLWNFSEFTDINIECTGISSYYLEGFGSSIEDINNASYILVPKYEPPHNDIQYSGITGTCKKNETPFDAALREVYEETGLSIGENSLKFLGECNGKTSRGKKNYTVYYYGVDISECTPITKEDFEKYKCKSKRDNKKKKVSIFIYGSFEEIYEKVEQIKYKINDGDDITHLAIVNTGVIKSIHNFNKTIIKKNSHNIFSICDYPNSLLQFAY